MADFTPLAGAHVEAFIAAKGARLLELLRERPLPGATWSCYSHGAFIPVHSPHADLFERLVVVLPRPEAQPPDEFRPWAERRLAQLDRYMRATNTGRVVRTVARDRGVIAAVMRRVGRDPADPAAELPPPARVPRLLARFARDVDAYVRLMGDEGLRWVRALRLYPVPRRGRRPDHVLGLDALQTVVGLREPPLALAPTTLVRGIVGELARVIRARAEELTAVRSPLRPWRTVRLAARRRRDEALADALEAVAARIGETDADPLTAARWLEAVRVRRGGRAAWLLVAVATILAGGGLAWRLLAR